MSTSRDKWLSFGCFLTGYNFQILKSCSELSIKRVIRYTSALLIICLLWIFIGASFTGRYLGGAWYWCIVGAGIMTFLVIQIERQVILASSTNVMLYVFRTIIAFSMALIGTVIIDQIIFKDDIEKRKMSTMDEEVKKILPGRTEELRHQIDEIDSVIQSKENERKTITEDLIKNPFVMSYETHVQKDTSKNQVVTSIRKQVHNPKAGLLEPLDKNIASLRSDKMQKDSMLLGLRPLVEAEIKQHVGFLDELEVMYILLSESGLSFCAWLIWFIFLLGLELFILVSKIGETENDYDRIMRQQMELHFRRIELLGEKSST